MTILECETCNHRAKSKVLELNRSERIDEYYNIYWNCPKCNIVQSFKFKFNTGGSSSFTNNPAMFFKNPEHS